MFTRLRTQLKNITLAFLVVIINLAFVAQFHPVYGRFSWLQFMDAYTPPTAPLELVGQIGGDIDAISVQGRYAYIGEGPRLSVIDLVDPSNPLKVGSSQVLPFMVKDVVVYGNYAFVALGYSGIYIMDISNPANPVTAGYYDTPGFANGIDVIGSPATGPYYAYVADQDTGLRILDVTMVNNPIELGYFDTNGSALAVEVSDGFAYVADKENLRIIDISDPSSPFQVSKHFTRGIARDVVLAQIGMNNYALVTQSHSGVLILDVTDPFHPNSIGGFNPGGSARRVEFLGGYAYVICEYGGLSIFDLSTPSNPSDVITYQSNSLAWDIDLSGDYAYFVDRQSLHILDTTDLSGAHEIGSLDTPGLANKVSIVGNAAYIADGYSGLRIVDISTPAQPSETGFFDTPGFAVDVTITGTLSLIADGSNGLRIVDINNPSAPSEVGFYDTPGYSCNVEIDGNNVYLRDDSSGMRIIDVSNPVTPTEISFYPATGYGCGMTIDGASHVYLADSEGFTVLDVTEVQTPTLLSSRLYTYDASDVTLMGDYAFIANDSSTGLHIMDISDPANPQLVGYQATPGGALGVVASDNFSYLADGSKGLSIINITDPTGLSGSRNFDTLGEARGLSISGNYVYIADGYSGLRVYDVSDTNALNRVGYYEGHSEFGDVVISGEHAYLASGYNGVYDIQVGDSTNPTIAGINGANGYASKLEVQPDSITGNPYVYVTDPWLGSFRILDFTDPTNPFETGYLGDINRAGDVSLLGDYAYIATPYDGVKIVDISNPITPTIIGQFDGFLPTLAVAPHPVTGQTLIYVGQDILNNFTIIDATDPYSPTLLSSRDFELLTTEVVVARDKVFIAAGGGGMKVVDVFDPLNPRLIGSYDPGIYAEGVFVDGNYAYIAAGYDGLRMLDISDPANPVETNYFPVPGYSEAVAVADGYAYVANWDGGLYVIQVASSVELQPDESALLETADGSVQIAFPENSVEMTTTVSILPQTAPTQELGDFNFGGLSFNVSAVDEAGNPVTSFLEPITITLNYSDEDVAGLEEDGLRLFYWDEDTTAWVDAASSCDPPSIYQREPAINRLSVAICHLSEFALLGAQVISNDIYLPLVRESFPPYYTISGRILDIDGLPLSGVEVNATTGDNTTTDDNGDYNLSVLAGSYTLTPSKSGYEFSPVFQNVTVPPDALYRNFIATRTCSDLFLNGDFETTGSWEIGNTAFPAAYNTDLSHTGLRSMRTGITNPADNRITDSYVRQSVTLPSNLSQAKLSFWLYAVSGVVSSQSEDLDENIQLHQMGMFAPDNQYVHLTDQYGRLLEILVSQRDNKNYWTNYEFDLAGYSGRALSLRVGTYNNGITGVASLYVDDVSIEVCP